MVERFYLNKLPFYDITDAELESLLCIDAYSVIHDNTVFRDLFRATLITVMKCVILTSVI